MYLKKVLFLDNKKIKYKEAQEDINKAKKSLKDA